MPLARITQSMAVPPVLHAPRQCQRFFAGVMTGGVAVVVERAQAQQVRPVPVQLDAPRLGQPLHRYLPFQPFDLVLRDSRHFPPSAENLSSAFWILNFSFADVLRYTTYMYIEDHS